MDSKRRQFKADLERAEAAAKASAAAGGGVGAGARAAQAGAAARRQQLSEHERLRAEGRQRREAAAADDEAAVAQAQATAAAGVASKARAVQCRVKIKWRRKAASHSEDSLATLFAPFGRVLAAALTGEKGNAAQLEFETPAAAAAAAAAYLDAKDMKVTQCGTAAAEPAAAAPAPAAPARTARDYEDLTTMRRRQAHEREKLRCEMEGLPPPREPVAEAAMAPAAAAAARVGDARHVPLPPMVPISLEVLQACEADVLARMRRRTAEAA